MEAVNYTTSGPDRPPPQSRTRCFNDLCHACKHSALPSAAKDLQVIGRSQSATRDDLDGETDPVQG